MDKIKVAPPPSSRLKSWICRILRSHNLTESVTDYRSRSNLCRRCSQWVSYDTGKIVRGPTNLLAPTIGSGILPDGTHWDSAQARMRKDQQS